MNAAKAHADIAADLAFEAEGELVEIRRLDVLPSDVAAAQRLMAGAIPSAVRGVPVVEEEGRFRSKYRELIVKLLQDVLIKTPVGRDSEQLAVTAQIECAG